MSPGMDAQKRRDRLLLFIGASLLVHCLLLLGVYHAQVAQNFKIPDNTVFVDLNRAPPVQTAQEKEKQRQIVESEIADQAVPKDTKYLGERDQSVEKESKAKQVESFRKGGAPAKAGSGGRPSIALKDLAPPSSKQIAPPTQAEIDGFREQEKKKLARHEHSNGGPQGAENAGSATNDYLKDVKDGDKTLLNTKEFVYFSYYRRIREKLEVAWNSKLRSTLGGYVYGGRHLATDRNYVTGVIVVLDRYGKITAVKVLQKSGAHDLDEAAVGAFNDAGPFPDPPTGLVDKNGRIEIRWDFVLQS